MTVPKRGFQNYAVVIHLRLILCDAIDHNLASTFNMCTVNKSAPTVKPRRSSLPSQVLWRGAGGEVPYPTPFSAMSTIVRRSTLVPLMTSSQRENSFGLWLMPSTEGMKIMPLGTALAVIWAAWPE